MLSVNFHACSPVMKSTINQCQCSPTRRANVSNVRNKMIPTTAACWRVFPILSSHPKTAASPRRSQKYQEKCRLRSKACKAHQLQQQQPQFPLHIAQFHHHHNHANHSAYYPYRLYTPHHRISQSQLSLWDARSLISAHGGFIFAGLASFSYQGIL